MISRENLLEQQLREKTLEIERLNNIIYELENYIDFYKDLTERQNKDLERLNNIMKEAREYIEKRKDTQKWRKESLKEKSTNIDIVLEHYRDILEILDKENK